MQLISLIGLQFGRLKVLNRLSNKGTHIFWQCLCACGNIIPVDGERLRTGKSRSCGCLRAEQLTKHGHAKAKRKPSAEYSSWQHMKQRCDNPKHKHFKYYGGRGIYYVDSWKDFNVFLRDMGPSNGLTLDRINNNGPYSPTNCRWATRREQANNRG